MQENLFSEFELSPGLLNNLTQQNFLKPTPIQLASIPLVLENKSIFAKSQTGSGKTGAFAIPIIQKLSVLVDRPEHPIYLILSPTRELALQTTSVFQTLGKDIDAVSAVCVIGGENLEKQRDDIRKNATILVATPGRLIDLYKKKIIEFNLFEGLVLDEADRLFDMGFQKEIEFIFSKMKAQRQVMLFTATENYDLHQAIYKYKVDPVEIHLTTDQLVVENIDHSIVYIDDKEKMPLLVGLLRQHQEKTTLIFCNTKIDTHSIAKWLEQSGFKTEAISGQLSQAKRTQLLDKYRSGDIKILVATDLAARGIDIEELGLVINYDLPQDASQYVHRIGRTGRNGRDGLAVSFCGFKDCNSAEMIGNLLGTPIPKLKFNTDYLTIEVGKKPAPAPSKRMENMNTQTRENRGNRSNNNNPRRDNNRGRNENSSFFNGKNNPRREENEKRAQQPRPKQRTTEPKQEIKTQEVRSKVIISTNFDKALEDAMNFFRVQDKSFIQHKVVAEGRKAFFFFGPKKTTFEFSVKQNYDQLAKPFVEKLIQYCKLDLDVSLFQENDLLKIELHGADEAELESNRYALAESIEHLTKKYLGKLVQLKTTFRIEVNGHTPMDPEEEKLVQLAERTKKKVLDRQAAYTLNSMSPRERRVIHKFFENDSDVKSVSIGDGHFKKIRIEPV